MLLKDGTANTTPGSTLRDMNGANMGEIREEQGARVTERKKKEKTKDRRYVGHNVLARLVLIPTSRQRRPLSSSKTLVLVTVPEWRARGVLSFNP